MLLKARLRQKLGGVLTQESRLEKAGAAMADATFQPALMRAGDAAFYIGVSPSTLRKLHIPRRVHGGLRLYDRRDLDAFRDGLPYENENREVQSCDAAFG